ncbi:hypothetical protein LPB19_08305 [Marinobacter salinisoli]|uniref:Secreted protein n=1 Tax=Marinobacter salinisoli TaxID=2769486 RepID=A0ABX7MY37_9GAMM|nr:hypothetical protein [Marinobacter salinisoli]QSP96362.1 hypothetical protein LPB19_08305 [Marinobacter salinisoli]
MLNRKASLRLNVCTSLLALLLSVAVATEASTACQTGDPMPSEMAGGMVNDGSCPEGSIAHIGTNEVWDRDGQDIRIRRPSASTTGDLLILVLHRTDDILPFAVNGWQRAAECYKENNGYDCLTVADCTEIKGSYCYRFENKYRGRDLAQVVFIRQVSSSEPDTYTFDLDTDAGGQPGWAILTAVRGADPRNPVRDWSHEGCDQNADSAFPSVYGLKGDMVLLSQSFDDAVSQRRFGAPRGTTSFGYVSNSDEAGFLFGGILSSDGPTGVMKTRGDGASDCKDALVSLTIRPQ